MDSVLAKEGYFDILNTEIENINNIKAMIKQAEINNEHKRVNELKRILSNRVAFKINEEQIVVDKESKQYTFFEDNIETISKTIFLSGKNVRSYDEAKKAICKIDLKLFFNAKVELKEYFNIFFKDIATGLNRSAYVNEVKMSDENGRNYYGYRLFLKSKKRYIEIDKFSKVDEYEVSFTLIDLYKTIYKIGYYQTVEELSKMLNMSIICKEAKYRTEQKVKYADNMITLTERIKDFPTLNRYIGKNSTVLEQLNKKALESLLTTEESYNRKSVFFCSVRHMEDRLKKIAMEITEGDKEFKTLSYGYINKLFMLYRVLGLLEVVSPENIPPKFIHLMPEKSLEAKLNKHYDTYFYAIPTYNSVILGKAERIAKKLAKANFTIENISRETITNILGEEIGQTIFSASIARYRQAVTNNIDKAKRSIRVHAEEKIVYLTPTNEIDDEMPF
jgi:predicted amino acid-binding ACT domain protein